VTSGRRGLFHLAPCGVGSVATGGHLGALAKGEGIWRVSGVGPLVGQTAWAWFRESDSRAQPYAGFERCMLLSSVLALVKAVSESPKLQMQERTKQQSSPS